MARLLETAFNLWIGVATLHFMLKFFWNTEDFEDRTRRSSIRLVPYITYVLSACFGLGYMTYAGTYESLSFLPASWRDERAEIAYVVAANAAVLVPLGMWGVAKRYREAKEQAAYWLEEHRRRESA